MKDDRETNADDVEKPNAATAQEFLDAVVNNTIEVKTDADLDDAVKAATKLNSTGNVPAFGNTSL